MLHLGNSWSQQQAIKQISAPAQLTNSAATEKALSKSSSNAQQTTQASLESSPTLAGAIDAADMTVDRTNPLHPWERLVEDGTNEEYFENIITLETNWTLPAVLHTQDGWEKLFDEESGDCYYLSLDDGRTTWRNPWASATSTDGSATTNQGVLHAQPPPSGADAIALISSRMQKQQLANSAHEMPPQSARHHTANKVASQAVRHSLIPDVCHLLLSVCPPVELDHNF